MRETDILEQVIRQFNAITGAPMQELPAKKLANKADTAGELRFGKLNTRFYLRY